MQNFDEVREEGYDAGIDRGVENVIQALQSAIETREELIPTLSAGEAYDAKTAGLKQALDIARSLAP